MPTTSAQAVQPHVAEQHQACLRLLVQLRKYAPLVRVWSATLPNKAKQMPSSQEQMRQQCLKMHSSAQAFLSIVSVSSRHLDQLPSSPFPAGALEQLRKAQAVFLKLYPHIQRDQERDAAQRLAFNSVESARRIPTLATALLQVEVDTEAVVAALERAVDTPTSTSGETSAATTANAAGLRHVESDATLTLTAEERLSALLELREALKAAVHPDSLPPYCPARPVKRQRIMGSDSTAESEDTNCSITPFIFEGARSWSAARSFVNS